MFWGLWMRISLKNITTIQTIIFVYKYTRHKNPEKSVNGIMLRRKYLGPIPIWAAKKLTFSTKG